MIFNLNTKDESGWVQLLKQNLDTKDESGWVQLVK